MQKRRISPSSRDDTLPLTVDDGRGARIPRRKEGGGTKFWAVAIVVTLISLAFFVGRSFTTNETVYMEEVDEPDIEEPLPFSEFETVNRALDNANIVALYFAASWCPMSTPITNLLEQHFSSVPNLLYSSSENSIQKRELAIVHVSSDTSQAALDDYLKPGWIAIPFQSDERNALKKRFSVCAQRELQELGIERKHEIPTLIVLDGETRGVITTSGVSDLEHQGAKALDHWIELQSIIRGLESKYSQR